MPHDRPFVFFDERREVTTYRCNLPHWRQAGVLYFITFRLGDSLPRFVIEGWNEERRLWLIARGLNSEAELEKLPSAERKQFGRHFNRQVHLAMDACHGACWLRRAEIAQIIADALHRGDGREYGLGDHVVMPNHVHVLVAPAPDRLIEHILKDWKGATARLANQQLGRTGKFWQRESYDRIVRDEKELAAFRSYIAANPAKAKLRAGEYLLGCGSLFHA